MKVFVECTLCTQNLDSKKAKYHEQARRLLEEHLGTPDTNRRSTEESLMADVSTSSLPELHSATENGQPSSPQDSRGEDREKQQQQQEPVEVTTEPKSPPSVSRTSDTKRIDLDSRKKPVERRADVNASIKSPTSPSRKVLPDPKALRSSSRPHSATPLTSGTSNSSSGNQTGGPRLRSREEGSPPLSPVEKGADSTSSQASRPSPSAQRKRSQMKQLEIKPVTSRPSAAAQRMLQSKKEKKGGAVEVDGERDGGEDGKEGEEKKEEITVPSSPQEVQQERKISTQSLEVCSSRMCVCVCVCVIRACV